MTDANWDLFRLFFTVVQAGSVNRASAALGVSQPTVSRRLGELEQQVGAPLFFRTPSGVRLTREGEELFRSAATVQAKFDAFQREFRDRLNARATLIKISASEGLARHWLIPRIARLRRAVPGVVIQVDASMEPRSLAGGDFDFVIRLGDPGEGDLIGKRVGEVRFGFFASPAYVERRSAPAGLDDLVHHDLVGGVDFAGFKKLRPGEDALQRKVRAALATGAAVRAHPFAAQHEAVAQGLGVALLAAPFAAADGLVRLLREHSLTVDLWLLRRRESRLRPLTRDVGRFLEREFAASQAWLSGDQAPIAAAES